MTAANQNIIIEQGATFADSLVLNQPGLPITPVNLTGYDARMSLRLGYSDAGTLMELTIANGRLIISDPATGRIDRRISAVDTATLDFLSAIYDMEIESPDGTVTRLVQGRAYLSLGVTK